MCNEEMLKVEVSQYADWYVREIENGCLPFMGRIHCEVLDGISEQEITDGIMATVVHFYRNLSMLITPRPSTASGHSSLPLFIAAPDRQIYKKGIRKRFVRNVPNKGFHAHFATALKPSGRVLDLEKAVADNYEWLLERIPHIQSVQVDPITFDPDVPLRYVLKSWQNGFFSRDDLILLPEPREMFAEERRLKRSHSASL
jgi:hypothetical protein